MKLIFAETHYWESAPRVDSHHLAREMGARGHEILYLSAPASPYHLAPGRGWPHRWRRIWRYCGQGRIVSKGVRAVVPLTLAPVINRPGMDGRERLRGALEKTIPNLRRSIDNLGFGNPDAVIVQSLFFASMADWFPGAPLIYRMTDDFSAFPGMPRALVEAEPELARQAKVVTASSRLLEARARAMGAPRVEYFPHGVDLEKFRAAGESPWDSREKLAVYVGAVDVWFDAELVAAAARALPDWRFEIIGPVGEKAELVPLHSLANVKMLGPRRHEELAEILGRARIGLIPFRRTPLIEAVHPLKLYEYLAAGLQVVSTRWDEIERMGAPATLVNTAEEFSAAAREAAGGNLNRAGIDFARNNSWRQRAEALERILCEATESL